MFDFYKARRNALRDQQAEKNAALKLLKEFFNDDGLQGGGRERLIEIRAQQFELEARLSVYTHSAMCKRQNRTEIRYHLQRILAEIAEDRKEDLHEFSKVYLDIYESEIRHALELIEG